MLNVMRDVQLPPDLREEVKEKLVNVLCANDWRLAGSSDQCDLAELLTKHGT